MNTFIELFNTNPFIVLTLPLLLTQALFLLLSAEAQRQGHTTLAKVNRFAAFASTIMIIAAFAQ